LCTACIQRLTGNASGKISDFLSQACGKGKYLSEWNVFTEGHEVNLVIARGPLAIGTHQRGGVIHFGCLAWSGVSNAHVTCEQPSVGLARNIAHGIAEQ